MNERQKSKLREKLQREISAGRKNLEEQIALSQRDYEEQIGEPLTSHTQNYKGNPAAEGAAAAKRDDAARKHAPFALTKEFDLLDMLDFANALAKLSDDHRVDVLCLINEDFGGIDHDNMIDVLRVVNEKGTSCDALDDLLDEFFEWHTSDQRERS